MRMMKLPHSLIPVLRSGNRGMLDLTKAVRFVNCHLRSLVELSLSRYPVESSSLYNQFFQANRIPTDIMKGKRGCSNFTECEQRAKFVQVLRATGFR